LPPQIANQRGNPIMLKFDETPAIEIREPHPSGLLQGFQLNRFQRLPPLDKPQPLPQNLARVLVSTRGNEVGYDPLMVVGKNDVPRWHSIGP
jgi:hypothetical protein